MRIARISFEVGIDAPRLLHLLSLHFAAAAATAAAPASAAASAADDE